MDEANKTLKVMARKRHKVIYATWAASRHPDKRTAMLEATASTDDPASTPTTVAITAPVKIEPESMSCPSAAASGFYSEGKGIVKTDRLARWPTGPLHISRTQSI